MFDFSREQKVQLLLDSIPGVVHFGLQPLTVFPDRSCKKVKLHLAGRGILNLERINFVSPDDVASAIANVTMSSAHGSSNPPGDLLKGKAIHTESELNPSWEIEFSRPVFLQEIKISNRLGIWGSRSYALNIDVWDEHARVRTFDSVGTATIMKKLQQFRTCANDVASALLSLPPSARNACGESIVKFSASVSKLIEETELLFNSSADRDADLKFHRLAVLRTLNEIHDALSGKELIATLQRTATLVDWLMPRASEARLSLGVEIELDALAWLFVSTLTGSNVVKMPVIRENDRLLTDSGCARHIEAKVNKGYAATGMNKIPQPIMFRAHGLAGSRLLIDTELFVRSMKEVESALGKLGYESAICYGTFLGAVRERGFIPHDDDVDMAVALRGSDADLNTELDRLIEGLKSLGVEASYEAGYQFLKVRPPASRQFVDVFPIINRGDGAVGMYMEQLKVRDVPRDKVLPFGSVELYGETFRAPASVDGFLTERYGPTWRTPQRNVGSQVLEV